MIHTGQIYGLFDRVVKAVEGWLAGRVLVVDGCDEDVVRKRLTQRIAEISLVPFVGMIGKDTGQAGQSFSAAVPDQAFDCGGLVLCQSTGQVTISLRLVVRGFWEFVKHWGHMLGAILGGIVSRGSRDERPATLLFGVGVESLFVQGSDARFVMYCRSGPIGPLVHAQRLIVQCATCNGSQSNQDFIYERYPLHTLIQDAKLGLIGRAGLIVRHVWILWNFLRAAIQNPLLTLLGRDIAYAAAVRALDSRRMIEAVVITNSVYASQPLWMRGPSVRGFRVHMVWYSQNAMPFEYEGDGSYDSEPRCRHICVDETWVWTQGFKKWLQEDLGLTGLIHVVGTILWYLPEAPTLRKDTDIRVVVCDVTPLRDEVALQIGLAENYYSGTNMIQFIEEIQWCCRELEARSGRPVRLSLKHKRSYNMKTHDPRYIEYIGRLSEPGGGIELIPFWTNMYALFSNSDLVIVAPYSSPAYVASTVGIRAIYFDPTKELVPTFEPAPLVEFASGRAELLRVVSAAISAPRLHNVYASNG